MTPRFKIGDVVCAQFSDTRVIKWRRGVVQGLSVRAGIALYQVKYFSDLVSASLEERESALFSEAEAACFVLQQQGRGSKYLFRSEEGSDS